MVTPRRPPDPQAPARFQHARVVVTTALKNCNASARWAQVLCAMTVVVASHSCLISPEKDYPVGSTQISSAGSDSGQGEGGDSGGEAFAMGGEGGAPMQSVGGGVTGGAAGGTGGDAPVACDFDPARLTGALSKSFTWQDFSVATGNVCASCTYEPCSQLSVAWGTPIVQSATVTYNPTYTPKSNPPPLVHVGKNDGICAEQLQCEAKPMSVSVVFSVAREGTAWQVSDAYVAAGFMDDECTLSLGPPSLTALMAIDLQQEIKASLIGLKIPCN